MLTKEKLLKIQKSFIAFDTETTGLSPVNDRIVELGAVRFVDGKVTDSFSTLVNPGIPIPPAASRVNHITNEMLQKAPSEEEVYQQFLAFLGDAVHGETLLCAHNASFDSSFLKATLNRLGIPGNPEFVDTLSLSKKYLKGLPNYKQGTIEAYLGLKNEAAHRAAADAKICGEILVHLFEKIEQDIEQSFEAASEPALICPNCGSALVKRISRQGRFAGREFYGCSAFPRCRYIKNI